MKQPVNKSLPQGIRALIKAGILPLDTHYFKMGKAHILVSSETINGRVVKHLSISRKDRYPNWDEIKTARYELLPNEAHFAIILPPREEYVNLEKNTFHLHQISGPVKKEE